MSSGQRVIVDSDLGVCAVFAGNRRGVALCAGIGVAVLLIGSPALWAGAHRSGAGWDWVGTAMIGIVVSVSWLLAVMNWRAQLVIGERGFRYVEFHTVQASWSSVSRIAFAYDFRGGDSILVWLRDGDRQKATRMTLGAGFGFCASPGEICDLMEARRTSYQAASAERPGVVPEGVHQQPVA